MSNSQWPEQPGHNPWAQQDPQWTPQTYNDAAGRDPRQPFGAKPQAPGSAPSLDQFTPPRRRGPGVLLVAICVLVAVGVVLLGLNLLGGDDAPTPAATASGQPEPRPVPTDLPTADKDATSIPFDGNGEGTFQIKEQRWTASGLELDISITVDSGSHGFVVYLFDNKTMASIDPDDLSPMTATQDRPYEGTVRFSNVQQAKATLVLANDFGRAITALPVKP